jgi:nucleoside-diphosphate-sugar epimerase
MSAGGVFMTGATGFIGRNLAAAYAGREIHALVRSDSDIDGLDRIGNITFHKYDGTPESVIRALVASKSKLVIHLAAYFVAEHKSEDIEPLVTSNLLLGTQVLEAMAVSGVRLLINAGTSWQHFQNHPDRPVCLYAATKRAYEVLVDYYVDAFQLKAITLKLFDTYGPGDPRPKLFNLLRNADPSKPFCMSKGDQLIDLVYIDDVVAAFVAAEERLRASTTTAHETFAVSSGNPRPLREIVESFLRIAQRNLKIEWGARAYRSREVMQTWTNYALMPHWEPLVDLEEGFARMVRSEQGGIPSVHR